MSSTKKPSGIWNDPVTKWLSVFIVTVVVGALLTAIIALLLGYNVFQKGAPQTMLERDMVVTSELINEATATADIWQDYIVALINQGKIEEARTQLEYAKTLDLDTTEGANFIFAEATLLQAEGDHAGAFELIRKGVDETERAFLEEQAREGTKNWARARGLHRNFKVGLAQLIFEHIENGENQEALEELNRYLGHFEHDAGMLIERARVKTELGDIAGARADYEAALRYMPHDEDAKKGLAELGESQ